MVFLDYSVLRKAYKNVTGKCWFLVNLCRSHESGLIWCTEEYSSFDTKQPKTLFYQEMTKIYCFLLKCQKCPSIPVSMSHFVNVLTHLTVMTWSVCSWKYGQVITCLSKHSLVDTSETSNPLHVAQDAASTAERRPCGTPSMGRLRWVGGYWHRTHHPALPQWLAVLPQWLPYWSQWLPYWPQWLPYCLNDRQAGLNDEQAGLNDRQAGLNARLQDSMPQCQDCQVASLKIQD